jgi:2-polyprenyl-3-methyl-5-hydroxy-6-metoxy-1,4-benzoquinol methylase
MERVVEPEILDGLSHDDPEAMRSRRDLRLIHCLMGNESWLLRTLRRFSREAETGICEWGAGDGALAAQMAALFPSAPVTAVDLAPRVPGLDPRITWHQGDLFARTDVSGSVLVANMFLHHFDRPQLRRLGEMMQGFQVLVFNEPDRSPMALLWSALLLPFVGRVTKHDMPASIRAGFRQGELHDWLGLSPHEWHIAETSTWRGARRVVAWRT